MGTPQDWAPYSSVDEAAKVYLRDPDLALDQLRSVIDLPAIKSFIMSRGFSEESWGRRESAVAGGRAHRRAPADHVARRRRDVDHRRSRTPGAERLGAHHPAVDDHRPRAHHRIRGARRRHPPALRGAAADVHPTRHAVPAEVGHRDRHLLRVVPLLKSVDNGGLAQMQRLLQFGRVLSRCMQ